MAIIRAIVHPGSLRRDLLRQLPLLPRLSYSPQHPRHRPSPYSTPTTTKSSTPSPQYHLPHAHSSVTCAGKVADDSDCDTDGGGRNGDAGGGGGGSGGKGIVEGSGDIRVCGGGGSGGSGDGGVGGGAR